MAFVRSRFRSFGCIALCVAASACAGGDWPDDTTAARAGSRRDEAWLARSPDGRTVTGAGEVVRVDEMPGGPRAIVEGGTDLFRNTYYDFPREDPKSAKDATVFDASCAPIAKVAREFHDKVCVQGSGRLADGATISFAKRDCACADACPRTGQKICFERLDPAAFPSGRGALGKPITPLRSIAVDPNVIPLGSVVLIPEYVGLTRPDGKPHDGCFVAEDRGVKVIGRQVDVFTGDPSVTATWNQLVPSNRGVHVLVGDPRCAGR
jgi:3D (Asp-Asp-Asp) domain-containing protein